VETGVAHEPNEAGVLRWELRWLDDAAAVTCFQRREEGTVVRDAPKS